MVTLPTSSCIRAPNSGTRLGSPPLSDPAERWIFGVGIVIRRKGAVDGAVLPRPGAGILRRDSIVGVITLAGRQNSGVDSAGPPAAKPRERFGIVNVASAFPTLGVEILSIVIFFRHAPNDVAPLTTEPRPRQPRRHNRDSDSENYEKV
jgi:hypothetical protein